MVGTSGSAAIRFSVVTASTRTAPLRTCCKVDADSAKCTFTWPPSSALSTSALPLNGTCTSLAPVMAVEHLGRQMGRGAAARRGVVDAGRLRLGILDQLLDAFHRQRRVHHQHDRDRSELGDRREILDRVVGRLLQAGVDREGDGGDQQRVTVGRGLGDDVGADRAAAARPVVNDGGLAPTVVHALRDQARHASRWCRRRRTARSGRSVCWGRFAPPRVTGRRKTTP